MEHLSEGLRAALSQPMMEELQKFLDDRAKESQATENVLKMTLEKVIQDISELEQSRTSGNEEWQRERERLHAAVRTTRYKEQEAMRLDIDLMVHEKRIMIEQAEAEREKILALQQECQRLRSLMDTEKNFDQIKVKDPEHIKAESDNWLRWTEQRVDSTLSMALTTASTKQKCLCDLKNRSKKSMEVSNGLAQEASITSMPCLSGLQSRSKQLKKLNKEMQRLQETYQKEMERVMAEATKQQEKIRAAELKERKQTEKKIRKELEKIHKAELKERKKMEKKAKKEAEKLEKQRQKEERAANRPSRFCFWRRANTANAEDTANA